MLFVLWFDVCGFVCVLVGDFVAFVIWWVLAFLLVRVGGVGLLALWGALVLHFGGRCMLLWLHLCWYSFGLLGCWCLCLVVTHWCWVCFNSVVVF